MPAIFYLPDQLQIEIDGCSDHFKCRVGIWILGKTTSVTLKGKTGAYQLYEITGLQAAL